MNSHLYQHHIDCVGAGEHCGQEEDTEEVTPARLHEDGDGGGGGVGGEDDDGGGKDDGGDVTYDDDDADLLLAVQSKE